MREIVVDELSALRDDFDVVICEGAGSPAEINLRATDLANMGLAQAAQLPVVVVGDIDRGECSRTCSAPSPSSRPRTRRCIAGFVINKFRGDVSLLEPGLDQLRELTGRPTLGVIPFAEGLSARRRGLPRRRRRRPRRTTRCPDRRRVAARRGDPAAPHLQLHRRRGARTASRASRCTG
ncbi:AAA family ATPase [Prescottella defluvii]|nr:AAA family ATPase [Prescottella defluvii]